MRNQSDWSLVAGRTLGFVILGVFGLGAAFLLAGFTVFALIFMVGLATVGTLGFVVAKIMRAVGGDRRQDRLIVDADYTVIDDSRRRQHP